ncbi:unnamed protein product [Discula destructiva]
MSSCARWAAARPVTTRLWLRNRQLSVNAARCIHVDGRARLSNEWAPSGGIAVSEVEDAHSKLIRAGFIRQSHSGIFQLLPLGLRVQDKITRLVDRHMRGLGASRVQLSAISSESLWEQTGRLEKVGSELFRFQDRKEGRFLLGPTHEEEITSIVAKSVQSYKSLPLRLYQITQKYRDELRPRHGLLRGRDFCMKDLYTFDYSVKMALQTYEDVRKAYSQIFIHEMKLPVLVAKASSGDMGGDLSHEYHIPTPLGEDHVVSCNSCDYVANEEVAQARINKSPEDLDLEKINVWRGISKDRKTIVNVWYGASTGTSHKDINTHAIKQHVPDLDAGIENAEPVWSKTLLSATDKIVMINLFDGRLSGKTVHNIIGKPSAQRLLPASTEVFYDRLQLARKPKDCNKVDPPNYIRVRDGDGCPHCSHGSLEVQKAIELGHTFHLGTRYSEPMNASIAGPRDLLLGSRVDDEPVENDNVAAPTTDSSSVNTVVPIQMGCHGIGISRIIGAVANHLADERGLNWPRAIAPYEAVIVVSSPKDDGAMSASETVYDALAGASETAVDGMTGQQTRLDAIIDDRSDLSMGWKLKDADLVGYPVMVVVGREWKASARVEVQCRRLGFKELKAVPELRDCIEGLLQQL